MKNLLIGIFILAGSSLIAQDVALTNTKSLKPSKKYEKPAAASNTKLIASVDKKKYYAKLVRSVNVIKD